MPNSSNGDSDFWSVSSQGSAIQPTKFPVSFRNCAPFRFYACIEKLLMLLSVQWVLIYERIICLRSSLPAVICLLWWKDQRGSFLPLLPLPGFQGCLDSRPGCIEKLYVRTPPPFYPLPRLSHGPNFFPPALARGAWHEKWGGCIILISSRSTWYRWPQGAQCPFFGPAWLITKPGGDTGRNFQILSPELEVLSYWCITEK